MLFYMKGFSIRADRKYSVKQLRKALTSGIDLSNDTDPLRDKIMKWSKENWKVVRYYADCPLIEDGDKCYECSDGMVTACYTTNKNKIEREEKEDDGNDKSDEGV